MRRKKDEEAGRRTKKMFKRWTRLGLAARTRIRPKTNATLSSEALNRQT